VGIRREEEIEVGECGGGGENIMFVLC